MLLVTPPHSGKTTVLKAIARSIEINHPEVELVVVMIDERPEEVTDMERHLEQGEVIASTFDRPTDEHCTVAELTLARAERMVEEGKDVVIILDGLTRLARAHNLAGQATGRELPGGLDAGALYPVKHFFGAARALEEGGSLTIVATVSTETGSALDDVVLAELAGTANSEVRLDRLMAERGVHPAIDVAASSTRHTDRLVDERTLGLMAALRSSLAEIARADDDASRTVRSAEATRTLVARLAASTGNEEFLNEFA